MVQNAAVVILRAMTRLAIEPPGLTSKELCTEVDRCLDILKRCRRNVRGGILQVFTALGPQIFNKGSTAEKVSQKGFIFSACTVVIIVVCMESVTVELRKHTLL